MVWIVGRYGSGLRDSSGFRDSNDLREQWFEEAMV